MATKVLSDKDYRDVNTALGHIAQTREELERAQRVGIPVEEPLATLELLDVQLSAIKREFFPERQ